MFLLVTVLLLLVTSLALVVLQVMRPDFRFAWLIATGGAFLAWISILLWQAWMPLTLQFQPWGSDSLRVYSTDTLVFLVDPFSWPYAFSLATLGLAVMLTAVARENFPAPSPWAGNLTLVAFGILAVLADNPFTLVLVWAALDLVDLITQLLSVEGEQSSERVVAGFAARLLGIGLLLWAGMTSLSKGMPLDFHTVRPEASVYLILAAGLRLGVLPLHLSTADPSTRRGFGTTLRLVSAASSLVLLTRIPAGAEFGLSPILLLLAAGAAFYGGWMWMRAPDELAGRPYWVIVLAALAVAAALRGNPVGAAAWGIGLILAGGALFLTSSPHTTLQRVLLVAGLWGLSALPFSPTASGWESGAPASWATWITWPFLVMAQASLAVGFFRHAGRQPASVRLESQPIWARNIYPLGIGLLLATLILLGLFGWDGALVLGAFPVGLAAAALAALLVWLTPRLRWLNPLRAHWVQPAGGTSQLDLAYRAVWNLYRQAGRVVEFFTAALEGDGGILWAMLVLVLFLSLLAPRIP